MPCNPVGIKMSSDTSISCELLADDLKGAKTMLILDCRSQADFTKSHIKGAVSIFLPSLMLRRLKAGKLNIGCIIQNNEAKDKFTRLCKTQPIVLYDEKPEPASSSPTSVINLLFKKLRQDSGKPIYLTGGYRNFEENFPEFCEGQNPENNAEKDIMAGLCNLKISEDSAYGTCDSENSDLYSPSANVPVEVIPHLYLGNAKTSADINVLKNNGITYILNVTPNVPNKFEEDTAFKYMKIPISDHLSQNLSRFFPEAIAFIVNLSSAIALIVTQTRHGFDVPWALIEEAWENFEAKEENADLDEARDLNQGVLVHCLAGISRSVTITVAYLMKRKKLSLNEAYDYVKTCKPNISPNFNFMGQLLEFQKSLGLTPNCKCVEKCTCSHLSLISQASSKNHGSPLSPT